MRVPTHGERPCKSQDFLVQYRTLQCEVFHTNQPLLYIARICAGHRYRDLIENIEGMLDKLPQDHHVWTHLLGDGTERESMADETTLTTAAMGAARQATNAELLRLGTHTVECVT
jgi:hypothetical protein